MANKIKYALYPGRVVSRNDGQIHYIDACRLAHLYGVNMRECVIVTEDDARRGRFDRDIHRLEALRPKCNGNYHLPPEVAIA